MFEARLLKSGQIKKILEAIKELLKEATFDCSDSGIQLQAMDDAHVSLVSMCLKSTGFDKFRCDRNLSMGINLERYGFIKNVKSYYCGYLLKKYPTLILLYIVLAW